MRSFLVRRIMHQAQLGLVDFEDSVLSLDKGDIIEIKDIAELLQEVI